MSKQATAPLIPIEGKPKPKYRELTDEERERVRNLTVREKGA